MAQYYISAAGNDSNNGTSTSTPWLTIGKVNTVGIVAGDHVSFRGGDTFTGHLLVNPGSQPSEATRIIIDSYGTGNATINCGDTYAVKIKDCGYVTVKNLISVGSGVSTFGTYPNKEAWTTSTTGGFYVEISTTSTWYGGIILDSLEASGSHSGIEIYSTNVSATAALENYRITNCYAHNCGYVGIWTVGTGSGGDHSGILFRYGYIADCRSTNNTGLSGYGTGHGTDIGTWSGFGIFPYNNSYTIVERCFVTECGEASQNNYGGGPVGIIFVESANCVIRSCESCHVYATAQIDGNGIDFDNNCANCIAEYNYIHDCEGAGLQLFGTNGPNTVRYNIMENCAKNNQACFKEAGYGHSSWYHNIFYHTKTASGPAGLLIGLGDTSVYYNNIFSIGTGATFGTFFYANSVVVGNTYHVRSGSSFSLVFNSVTYTTFAAMQAAGLEKIGARLFGATGDPVFAAGGSGTTLLPTSQVSTLANYDLGVGSVARGAGVNFLELSIIPQRTDWHGNAAIGGETDTLNGVDSGAVRYGSTASSGTTTSTSTLFLISRQN